MKIPTIIALLAASAIAAPALPDSYCTFYSDSACTQQVGSVSYNVYNEGCFQNDGGYIRCGGALAPNFALVQSPSNDDGCGCQSNCAEFPCDGPDCSSQSNPWNGCVPINLTPGYTDFRIENNNNCPANNCPT